MNEEYRTLGVSVKDHTPYSTLARQVPGLSEGILSDDEFCAIYRGVQEDFWSAADKLTQDGWGVECVSAGRSGGWAVPFQKGEGYTRLDEEWRVTIIDLADHYINEVYPTRLKEAIKQAKADAYAQEAEDIRLSLIGTGEKVTAYEVGMDLARGLLKLSDQFGLDLTKLLEEAREERTTA